jgi:DNA-binding NtrC family response regulator
VIAATNRDLAAEVAAGRFREDLYWRVHVVALTLPPLRERPGDVLLLAESFLARFAAEHGRPPRALSAGARAALAAHRWPGNVRELEHCLERAVLLARGDEIVAPDLGPALAPPPSVLPDPPAAVESGDEAPTLVRLRIGVPLREALEEPEREIIRRALERNGGNRKRTAEMLDVDRTTLFNKMRKYRLMEIPSRGAGAPGSGGEDAGR